jgi:hypothetical protein
MRFRFGFCATAIKLVAEFKKEALKLNYLVAQSSGAIP